MSKQTKKFRKPEKIDDIMAAACRAMAKNGYAQMSMRHIAEEAGVHKSLLYHYFKNKDELFIELFRFLNQQYIDIVTKVTTLPIGHKEKMETGFHGFQAFVEKEPKWLLMILDLMVQAIQKPDSKQDVISLYSQLMALISKNLAEGKESNELNKAFDEKIISSLILSTLMGLGIFYVMDKELIDFHKSSDYFLKLINEHLAN